MKKDEVKLLMKQNQVKQWEVAEAMGISEFTLCRWLRKDLKGKQLERLNSAIKKVRSGKEETHGLCIRDSDLLDIMCNLKVFCER